MNLELFESFGQNIPEEADGVLDCAGQALCCKFNRWGSLLAVGCNDGRVCVFDFITRQLAKVLAGHQQPITSLSWSRNGRRLLSSSSDHAVQLWDVLSGEAIEQCRFSTAVLKTQFHPRDNKRFLVCVLKKQAVIVNREDASCQNRPIPADDEQAIDVHVTACFSRRGEHILTGSTRGKFCVFQTDTLQQVASFRLQSYHAIKTLDFARKTDYLIASSADRVIRVYDLAEVLLRGNTSTAEPVQKLQDMVNKTAWKTCCLSGNGDYVCAGSSKSHSLYIWERHTGSLVKILQGPKGEALMDVQWHPARPVICSVSNGVVSVWSQCHVENWSAFAPDFRELEDNVEYEERESEFDVDDEDHQEKKETAEAEADVEVDVCAVGRTAAGCSSDEDSDYGEHMNPYDADARLWYLPVAPDIEHPEDVPSAVALLAAAAVSEQQQPMPAASELSVDGASPPKRHRGAGRTYDIDVQNGAKESNAFVAPSNRKPRGQGTAATASTRSTAAAAGGGGSGGGATGATGNKRRASNKNTAS